MGGEDNFILFKTITCPQPQINKNCKETDQVCWLVSNQQTWLETNQVQTDQKLFIPAFDLFIPTDQKL